MKVFSLIITFGLILLTFNASCIQSQTIISNTKRSTTENVDPRIEDLNKQANELIIAFNKNDFDKFVEFTHPKVIEKAESRDKLISMMKKVSEQNPKIFETLEMSVGTANLLVELESLLFGVVPIKIDGTTHKKHNIVQENCIVGVSEDSGKTWKFISGEKFEELFPSLKGKIIIIPEKTFVDGIEQ